MSRIQCLTKETHALRDGRNKSMQQVLCVPVGYWPAASCDHDWAGALQIYDRSGQHTTDTAGS